MSLGKRPNAAQFVLCVTLGLLAVPGLAGSESRKDGGPNDGKPTGSNWKDRIIEVQATSGSGSSETSLGMLHRGAVLSFQYVGGEWTAYPPSGAKSPDDPSNNEDLNCPTPSVCVRRDGANTEIARIGTGTATKPWTMVVPDTGEIVVNMESDRKWRNNLGSVKYRVMIQFKQ